VDALFDAADRRIANNTRAAPRTFGMAALAFVTANSPCAMIFDD
jgi:hypothetical protein